MSKPVLYTYSMSVWAAVPELALIELGYTEKDVEKKTVNLREGENFNPAFLKINPNATVPASTAEVTKYLVQNAKSQIKAGSSLIAKIHEDLYDPNFPRLLARDDDELSAKAGGFQHDFLANRQKALDKYSVTEDAAVHKEFYDNKLAGNAHVLSIYQSKVTDDVKNGFFEQSKAHWDALRSFILDILPAHLPNSGFIGGAKPGEDDFHVAAWLARIASVSGAKRTEEGFEELEKEVGVPIPERVAKYWNAWIQRESWKMVYQDGLH
ncbi:hypothetical protein PILCRDRAFT_778214 [Piloderma croceum F 1598]|uniref:Uncharacterized protein n=1 Tax=Piloderma croceum (strain F 1598) TaxID=765440 RepID=A0A0C3BGJ9_PILCF|nr:hypothetical protein PILCRDRAFT_778214 [Piloderma croceum F 1598]